MKEGMPISCEIKLEKNRIYAGDAVRGIVHLTFNEKQIVRILYVEINGKAEQTWRNGPTRGADSEKYYHTDTEQYLHERLYLIGGSEQSSLGMHFES